MQPTPLCTQTGNVISSVCGGGRCFQEIQRSECPPDADLRNCDASSIDIGDLCEADGECSLDQLHDNCGDFDVYRRVSCGTYRLLEVFSMLHCITFTFLTQ